MTNLRILHARNDCGVNDDSFVGLNLIVISLDI